jgi:hypothetical protein
MRRPTRGNAAEAAVLNAFIERDFDVLVPFGGGHPYDLVVDLSEGLFLRVQCKTAWPHNGCPLFNSRTTDHGRGPVSYVGLADIFGVYFPTSQSVYVIPIQAMAGSEGRLRLEPTRNNQRRRVRLARDYEIDRWTRDALSEVITRSMTSAG